MRVCSRAVDAVLLGALAGALFGAVRRASATGLSRGVPVEVARRSPRASDSPSSRHRRWSRARSRSDHARDVLVVRRHRRRRARPLADRVRPGDAPRRRRAHRGPDRRRAAALVRPRDDLPGRERSTRASSAGAALIVAAGASLSFERSGRPRATGRSARARRALRRPLRDPRHARPLRPRTTRRSIRWCAPSSRSRPPRSCSSPGRGSSSGTARRCRCAARSSAFLPAGICLGVAYLCLIVALDRGRVTIVAPLNATQSLWGVIFAATLLGKREAIGPRLVAAALLVVAGGVLIGISR